MEADNTALAETVEPENDLKNMLVEHVGNKLDPEDQNVTLEMVIEVVAKEFPEFMLAVAEENWIRGYQQALDDAEQGEKLYKDYISMQDPETGEHHDETKSESD
jgi:hypothetical protein